MEKFRLAINKILIIFSSIVLIALVIAVTWQVVSRYVLNNPSSFTDEFSRFSLIWIGMLGATYAFSTNSHLSIDILETKLSNLAKLKLQICIYILVLLFLLIVPIYGGGQLSLNTMGQLSPSLQVPMGMVYSILPISSIINASYIILDIINCVLKLKGGKF
ncbi:MAG: TRAP transporter small permease [Fusobacteriaceae bacterium]